VCDYYAEVSRVVAGYARVWKAVVGSEKEAEVQWLVVSVVNPV
jgi:hypothetical protein